MAKYKLNNLVDRVRNTLSGVPSSLDSIGNFINKAPAAVGSFGSKNIVQPTLTNTYQSAKPILDYLDPRGYSSNDTQKLIGAAKATPMTALNLFGLSRLRAPLAATSYALGGTLNTITGDKKQSIGQRFMEGGRSGLKAAPTLAAVGSFTNPLIEQGANRIASMSRFANNPFSKQIASRTATGLGNIPEGIIMNSALGRPEYSLGEAGLDFTTGALFGSPTSRVGKTTAQAKGTAVFKEDVQNVREIMDYLNSAIYKKKPNLDLLGKIEKDAEVYRSKYNIMPKAEWNKLGLQDRFKWVSKAIEDNFYTPKSQGGAGLKMNLVDSEAKQQAAKKLPGIMYTTDKRVAEGKSDRVIKSAYKEIGAKEPVKKKVKDFANEFYTDWVNRFHPVESLVDKVTNKGTIKIKSDSNPIYKLKRLMGAGGIAELRHKQKLDPIIKELGDVPKEDFDVFLKAQRDIELAGRNIKGSNAELAQQRIDALGTKYDIGKFQSIADKLYQYQSNGLNKLKQAGFLSDEVVKNISGLNQKYVPFQRVQDEIDNFLGLPTNKLQQSTTPIKKIKGSDKAILSPLESVIANTYKIEAAVAKNEVAKSIIKLDSVNPLYKGLFTKVKKSANNTISVWENGKKSYYEAPEDIIKVVKGLNEEGMSTLTKILSAPAAFFRQQTTGRNPAFFVPNVVRDQFDAAINAKYGYIPFFDYLDGLGHLIKEKYGGGDPLVKQWYESGGSIFFENMGGRKEIRAQIKDATQQKHIIEKLSKWVVSGVDTLSDFSEKPTRLGVFKRALKATGDTNIAAYESREATLDFARMGAKMKVANSLIPFLNVQVQGFDKMIRSMKENPAKVGLMMAAYGMLPQTMTSLYNNMYHGDEYTQVPDFEKEDNFIILTGEKDKGGNPIYVKIPKGHITKIITSPTDNFITWMAGNNPQDFSQLALSLLTSTVPVVGDGSNPSEIASRTIGNLLPQFAKPAVEAQLNKDTFRNRPIVDPYTEKLPPAAQFYSNTPEQYKQFGKQFNLSPAKVQHVAEGYGGGLVKEGNNLVSTVQSIAQGETPEINKIPLGRRFVGSYSGFDTDRPSQEDQIDPATAVKQREMKLKLKQKAANTPTIKVKTKQIPSDNKEGIKKAGFFDSFFGNKQPEEEPTAISYLDSKGNIKTIDYGTISDMPESSGFERVKKQKEIYSLVTKVVDAPIDEAEKDGIYKKLGVTKEDAQYYSLAKEDNDLKTEYVVDEIKSIKERKDVLNFLAQSTREINGKSIVTTAVLSRLRDRNIISEDEYKVLKSHISGKPAKGKKGKKLTKLTLPKVSPMKVSKINLSFKAPPTLKLRRTPRELTAKKKRSTMRIKV